MFQRFRSNFPLSAKRFALLLALSSVLSGLSHAQQINWSSQLFSSIVDSNGNPLPPENFVFELGYFNGSFDPAVNDFGTWIDNWTGVDIATYTSTEYFDDNSNSLGTYGYFTGQFNMSDVSGSFDDLGIEREAFIWIRNATEPVPGTEWLVVRAATWLYPQLDSECCSNDTPTIWSVSELGEFDVPLFGNQSGFEGPGERSVYDSTADLQTYTFIPEPSSALLVGLAGVACAFRRRKPTPASPSAE